MDPLILHSLRERAKRQHFDRHHEDETTRLMLAHHHPQGGRYAHFRQFFDRLAIPMSATARYFSYLNEHNWSAYDKPILIMRGLHPSDLELHEQTTFQRLGEARWAEHWIRQAAMSGWEERYGAELDSGMFVVATSDYGLVRALRYLKRQPETDKQDTFGQCHRINFWQPSETQLLLLEAVIRTHQGGGAVDQASLEAAAQACTEGIGRSLKDVADGTADAWI